MPGILPLTNGEFSGKKDARIVRAAIRLVILRKTKGRFQFLFVRHPTKGLEFPGGAIEPNELPYGAALRELQEESGMTLSLDASEIKMLGFKDVIDSRGGYWLDIIFYTVLNGNHQILKTTKREYETKWLFFEDALLECRRDEVEFITHVIAELNT